MEKPPTTAKYEGDGDFYDVHVHDDQPRPKDWQRYLRRPLILGEVGGDLHHGFKDQSVTSTVVGL